MDGIFTGGKWGAFLGMIAGFIFGLFSGGGIGAAVGYAFFGGVAGAAGGAALGGIGSLISRSGDAPAPVTAETPPQKPEETPAQGETLNVEKPAPTPAVDKGTAVAMKQ
jgi:hypothetical protein